MPKFNLEIEAEWTLAAASVIDGELISIPAGNSFYFAVVPDGETPDTNYQNYEFHPGSAQFQETINSGFNLWLATRRHRIDTSIDRPAYDFAAAQNPPFTPYASYSAFLSANIPPPVDAVSALIGGVKVSWRRDPSGTIGPTGDGGMWSPHEDASPQHFGALANGVANDTVALNAFFYYLRALVDTVPGEIPTLLKSVRLMGGRYFCSGSINATDINGLGLEIDCSGAEIHSAAVGKTAFDLTASRFMAFNGLSISGASWAQPRYLVQMSRKASGISAGEFTFHDMNLQGYSSEAHLINYASEVNTFSGTTRIYQESATGTCFIGQGVDRYAPASDFSTVFTGPQSFLQNVFENYDFRIRDNTNTREVMFITRPAQLKMVGYDAGFGTNIVIEDDGGRIKDLTIHAHHESTIPHCVEFRTTAVTGRCNLSGFTFIEPNNRATDSVFSVDASVTDSVRFLNADVRIQEFNAIPVSFFDTPSKYEFYGDFRTGRDVGIIPDVAVFKGRLFLGDKEYAGLDKTYLPVLIGSTTAGVNTYTTQNGSYRRIGDMVFADIEITLSAKASVGNLSISLPVPISILNPAAFATVGFYSGAGGLVLGESIAANRNGGGATSINLVKVSGPGTPPLVDTDINNTFRIMLSVSYKVDP